MAAKGSGYEEWPLGCGWQADGIIANNVFPVFPHRPPAPAIRRD